MTEIMTFLTDELTPNREVVLSHQGIPPGKVVPKQIEALCTRAFDLALKTAAPVGILSEISKSDFATVYRGEGRNEPDTPVGDIFSHAHDLALFALTLGKRISQEIEERFASNDFALACMLDSVASAATDRMAETAQNHVREVLSQKGRTTPATGVLRYSPGYCGWHISGQRKLFEFLRPEQIGISLRDSFLMQPLKSVSGVVISAPREIHSFEDSYPFCNKCETHGCRERIRTLLAE